MTNPLHIVLVEPEIPPNTGNIARLCACTGCALHLVHPLGFSVDDRSLKRAGLDYWQYLDVFHHDNWQALRLSLTGERNWFGMSSKVSTSYWDAHFKHGDVLVFGPETRGLSQQILAELQPLTVPMRADAPVRSLNLATTCGIAVFEGLRQLSME